MDSVTIKPYSLSNSSEPTKATVLIKGNMNSIFSELTKFNIILNETLNPDLYTLSENVTEIDQHAVLSSDGKTITTIKTNLNLFNLSIISKLKFIRCFS
jgi:hypothetical protein